MTAPHRPPDRRTWPRARLFDAADRAGAFVTLVAIVVLGLMLGSAFPGTPDTARSTLTVTFDH